MTATWGFAPASSKEFQDIQATIECGFTLKCVRDMTRTYSHIQAYSLLHLSFSFLLLTNFLFSLWWFGSETNLLFYSFVTNWIYLWFLTFSIVLSKTESFISLKKSFSNSFFASFLNLVLILMYCFNHAFWLNWITLCTLFSINPWFKSLMWITYLFIFHTANKFFSFW